MKPLPGHPKAPIRLAALKTQVCALSTSEPAADLILAPSFRSSTRSCGPLSGQWPKPADTRRVFEADPRTTWCAQLSPTGETPPGRTQGGKSKRLRSHNPAPLPARNQAEIFSVCFQQEPHVNKVLLLFVAHAYCALAESRSMLPHTIVAAVCNGSYSMQCCLFANIHTLLVLYLPMTAWYPCYTLLPLLYPCYPFYTCYPCYTLLPFAIPTGSWWV